jgi:ABC-type sugar transport system permease subunit
MKDLLLLIVAIILFLLLVVVGFAYTAWYYLTNEKEKKGSFCFRIAFGIDVFACIVCGEFVESFVCIKRGLTSFGNNVTISACVGESIVQENFKSKYEWFNRLLDFVFSEKNHCINAYIKEIL